MTRVSRCRNLAEPNAVSASGTHVAWADSSPFDPRPRSRHPSVWHLPGVLGSLDRRQLTQAPVGAGDWRFEVSPDAARGVLTLEKVGIADVYVSPGRRRTTAAHELERRDSKECRGRPMVRTSLFRREPPASGCGESGEHLHTSSSSAIGDIRWQPRVRRSRDQCPGKRRASHFKQSHAMSTFS